MYKTHIYETQKRNMNELVQSSATGNDKADELVKHGASVEKVELADFS